jgi:hypothetical protein
VQEKQSGQMRETALYAPIKAFLEGQGYEVKAEVRDCDVVAVRGDEAPVVVELKLSLSLALLLQGVDRLAITDWVYVAVPTGKVKDAAKLCRRLGLGLISVRLSGAGGVVVHADPGQYQPRKVAGRKTALLKEFQARVGDPNCGGQVGRKLMTAYRQNALRLADALARDGAERPVVLARTLAVPKAATILRDDYYGWFQRVSHGVYDLRDAGRAALEEHRAVVETL